ncbi:ectoine/hydroxyectoine ABC transporter solute-binding protein EhuB [Hydrogenophaga sp. T4]|nr:ectoine/hydroxyectoine ABC transporter solute-binding protein EhuB [Hydrogenophaga sp. T4]
MTAWHLVAHNTQWALEVRTLSDGPAGLPAFAFRLDDARLRDQMNQQLQSFLGSDEHRELVQAFGFTSDEMPPESP